MTETLQKQLSFKIKGSLPLSTWL